MADFGNWKTTGPQRYADLASIFARSEDTHAKASFPPDNGIDADDFGRCLDAAKAVGYRGPYTLIYEDEGDDEWAAVEIERDFVLAHLQRRPRIAASGRRGSRRANRVVVEPERRRRMAGIAERALRRVAWSARRWGRRIRPAGNSDRCHEPVVGVPAGRKHDRAASRDEALRLPAAHVERRGTLRKRGSGREKQRGDNQKGAHLRRTPALAPRNAIFSCLDFAAFAPDMQPRQLQFRIARDPAPPPLLRKEPHRSQGKRAETGSSHSDPSGSGRRVSAGSAGLRGPAASRRSAGR